MGKDSRNKELSNISSTAGNQYSQLYGSQTGLEKELIPQSQEMWQTYKNALGQQTQDYGNIMGGYQNYLNNPGNKISAQQVGVSRPAELTKAYGYLDEAAPGYRNFAETGGYSPTDIQELRARGSAPITSAYSNAMMEMNRARALGGSAGSPNYIAALSRLQRELPQQLATATTGVNAQLADAIRQGKLSGLAGLSGIGGTMGGMAGAESGRQLQAGIANQGADLQAQGMNQQATLNALGGMQSLYGTTPAMAATFGNQALSAMGQRLTAEQMRNQMGLGLLGAQTSASGAQTTTEPWWKQILGAAGSVIPYAGNLFGGGQQTAQNGGGIGSFGEQVLGSGFTDPYGNSNYWNNYNFGNEGGYVDPYFSGLPPGGSSYTPSEGNW